MFLLGLITVYHYFIFYRPTSVLEDLDAAFDEEEMDAEGEALVSFADDVVSDAQTETDVKNLEGRHKMSLQQIKEQILSSVSTMLSAYSTHKEILGQDKVTIY